MRRIDDLRLLATSHPVAAPSPARCARSRGRPPSSSERPTGSRGRDSGSRSIDAPKVSVSSARRRQAKSSAVAALIKRSASALSGVETECVLWASREMATAMAQASATRWDNDSRMQIYFSAGGLRRALDSGLWASGHHATDLKYSGRSRFVSRRIEMIACRSAGARPL